MNRSVCVFTLRWSTRLALEADYSLSATWMNWTALWSPSSTEVVLVCHRLQRTWSSSFTSHTPSNAHADNDTLKVQKKKIHLTEGGWAQNEKLLTVMQLQQLFVHNWMWSQWQRTNSHWHNTPTLRLGMCSEGCKVMWCWFSVKEPLYVCAFRVTKAALIQQAKH